MLGKEIGRASHKKTLQAVCGKCVWGGQGWAGLGFPQAVPGASPLQFQP